ncbi:uncharacterized protein cubi_03055 [Cryptosporidium ubiquitum]|uniref:Uncharacterized protein n=1 Tax=Cryptosporidium ubiquitum TaxID=857276 RepID=A0A1J4MPL6_9CRYT|nr:uncharacterized protein cubi_03055 [Cryptosporidium ubiquitum]OII74924.1 hypothetical protein cubi_03055 [Cryptosporidium ubiquitum]
MEFSSQDSQAQICRRAYIPNNSKDEVKELIGYTKIEESEDNIKRNLVFRSDLCSEKIYNILQANNWKNNDNSNKKYYTHEETPKLGQASLKRSLVYDSSLGCCVPLYTRKPGCSRMKLDIIGYGEAVNYGTQMEKASDNLVGLRLNSSNIHRNFNQHFSGCSTNIIGEIRDDLGRLSRKADYEMSKVNKSSVHIENNFYMPEKDSSYEKNTRIHHSAELKCVGCHEISSISNSVYLSINESLEICFKNSDNKLIYPIESLGVIYQVAKKKENFSIKILIYHPNRMADLSKVFSDYGNFKDCISKYYNIKLDQCISNKPGINYSTDFKFSIELPSKEELEEINIKNRSGEIFVIRKIFKFKITSSTENFSETQVLVAKDNSTIESTVTSATTTNPTTTSKELIAESNQNTSSNKLDKEVMNLNEIIYSNTLCKELSSDEVIEAIKFQNTFMLPDIIYLEVVVLLRRVAKRIDFFRSAEESLSIIMPGIGGLLVSDIHCEESLRVSLVAGELTIPGVGPNVFPAICQKLQQCLGDQSFHNSVLISLSKSKKYVDFALKRNRSFMWETLNKMVGVLGNTSGLKSYQLWLEMEILIKNTIPDEDVLHSDLPKEMILIVDLIKNSKSQTVECTISVMKIGASYDIRLSQISEVARICSRIFSDSSSYLSVDEMRLISDTTILSRIADWMIGTFILEKHIPPGVTKPAACMYLSAITSPMDYSSITNFLWPRVVFAISSSSSSALSFTTRSVDPENCRKSLIKILKKIGDKIQINIDETCGKMANCILNGRIGRISVDDTINNALSQSQQTIKYDFGTNSASLRLARFIFESKAPKKSKRNGFSKLSAPLRGSVLFGHLQTIMPGGFSINDVVKFVHSFTKEAPPNGPAKKCFKVLIKYIPIFISSDNELKTICINAFGPWIMPDILVSDVTFSQSTISSEIIV